MGGPFDNGVMLNHAVTNARGTPENRAYYTSGATAGGVKRVSSPIQVSM